MDYKSLIKSRSTRIKIMQLLSFVPDKLMVKLQYRIKTGRKLNLKNPKRYTEKLQWYKLYYRNPLMTQCANKLTVRDYVAQQGYENILNELYGVYDTPEQINFDDLPNQFVIKDTLGGGGNSVIICNDKTKADWPKMVATMHEWIKPVKSKHPGREWVYDNGINQIIVEKFIPSDAEKGGLIDYKFFCFNGKVSYVYGLADRKFGKRVGLGVFNKDFNLMPYLRADEEPLKRKLSKPNNYKEMLACAEKLSAPFPHARIDLYNQDNKIIFGEITFFDGSGYMKFEPDEFDFSMGKKFLYLNKEKTNEAFIQKSN